MEIINKNTSSKPIRAILFDFDGTISTLRCGWENVMAPLFCEILDDGRTEKRIIAERVSKFIDESTGIQTILQMKWLKSEVEKSGRVAEDIWEYKKMYNDRLMLDIKKKLRMLEEKNVTPDNYLMCGAVEFLCELRKKGIKICVASGTDHPDVVNEAKKLGVYDLFDEIKGAPLHEESCSKEAVISRLLEEGGFSGDELAVCGDGKVEIALGGKKGARTIGLASNEKAGCGVDNIKRKRLIDAGADIIVGDFLEKDDLLSFLGL